jgi:hypothetical protein
MINLNFNKNPLINFDANFKILDTIGWEGFRKCILK